VKAVLIADAAILAIAVIQALVAIMVAGRPLAGLAGFFFQTFFLTLSAVAIIGFEGKEARIVAWTLVALAGIMVAAGFRSWFPPTSAGESAK